MYAAVAVAFELLAVVAILAGLVWPSASVPLMYAAIAVAACAFVVGFAGWALTPAPDGSGRAEGEA